MGRRPQPRPQIRSWTGGKNDTTSLGLVTILLAAIAFVAALAVLLGRARSAQGRLAAAVGLLVPGAICFTTAGRLWYLPGSLLVAAGVAIVIELRRDAWRLIESLERNWAVLLAAVLALVYLFLGVVAHGLAGTLGVAGGLLALLLLAWREGMRAGPARALLVVAALPFAAVTWWSAVTPLIGLLLLAVGAMAATSRTRPSDAVNHPDPTPNRENLRTDDSLQRRPIRPCPSGRPGMAAPGVRLGSRRRPTPRKGCEDEPLQRGIPRRGPGVTIDSEWQRRRVGRSPQVLRYGDGTCFVAPRAGRGRLPHAKWDRERGKAPRALSGSRSDMSRPVSRSPARR